MITVWQARMTDDEIRAALSRHRLELTDLRKRVAELEQAVMRLIALEARRVAETQRARIVKGRKSDGDES